ncbi:helix-turn-helix domain-containing protein [Rappaport israeli]|uniref:helix-turn-helix domain-containing protein n=1 Tax=Rappaport israeli TaxID=1839807 RepID=UPI00093194AA|nr:helix-turn-helix transcriptional regulator [Rappaport israeli]
MSFGERLKAFRVKKNLTQEGLASELGVTRKTQRSYEKEERRPDSEYLMKISRMGADIKYLITGERDGTDLDHNQLNLLDFFEKASPAYRQAVFDLFMIEQSSEQPREKLRLKQNIIELLTGSRQQNGLTQEQSELLELWQNAPLLVRNAALNVLMTRDSQIKQGGNSIGNISGSFIGGIKQNGNDK